MKTSDLLSSSEIKQSSNGFYCDYFKVSDTVGLKRYDGHNVGYNEYLKAKAAHEIGVGPRVWDYSYDEQTKFSGFLTEHVFIGRESLLVIYEKYPFKHDLYETMRDYLRSLAKDLYYKLRDFADDCGYWTTCWGYSDLHAGNVGILNGRPVLIDFSHINMFGFPTAEEMELKDDSLRNWHMV